FVQPRAEEKGLSFSLQTGEVRHPYVRADAGKIRHVLNNLLGNAIKFTPEGGVTLRCETREAASDRRCEIVLEVEDTGPGIDPALHARVFEPFVQERSRAGSRDGVGLGLSICRDLTGVMGGTLDLESEPGRGSLFRVRLPAGAAAAEDVRTHAEAARRVIGLAPGQRPWRILVVDDNADDRAVLKALLEDASFLVLEAGDGREGVEAFARHAPDLVWMDMRMAVMDGYEAVRQIRRLPRGNRTPVIAMTASAFREQAADILAAGCDDVIVKPASEPSIFEAMQRFLPLEYRYAQDRERVTPGGFDPLLGQIGALPDTVREALRAAAGTLRQKELDTALRAVRARDPDLAGRLAELGQDLRFDRILELVAASERR
ncbi:MAG: response regulator, partial [Acidobacteria bacterium]